MSLAVVLDRRWDKNCDVGDFEFVYKQVGALILALHTSSTAHTTAPVLPAPLPLQPKFDMPAYNGAQLTVEGSAILKPRQQGARTRAKTITLGPNTSRERQ